MAWKQDLAKLKQQIGPETPAPKVTVRPVPRPSAPATLDDEDAMFLSAMGLKAAKPAPKAAAASAAPEAESPAPALAPPPPPPPPETFQDALKELKGLKPLPKGLPAKAAKAPAKALPASPASAPPPALEAAPPAAEVPLAPPSLVPVPTEPGPPPAPLRFQLAAGMALEVDGSLDLRGHTLSDAVHRLQDRLGDGLVLGWRSLLVNLGPDPVLHQGLLDLLASGQVPMVARYAQAPVPMGGNQAWLLYFGPSPTKP